MSWLSIGLLAGTYALGARAGAGVVADEVTMLVTPWAGARWGEAAVAIQAPLRVSFAEGRLRERDWDEGADFGRLLRFARYGDFVRVGQVVDLTLGQGTLVRRYHNGVDDDHHRLGAVVAGTIGPLGVEVFADQVFAAPVGGARVQCTFDAPFTVGATFAGDFAAPVTLSGGVDDTGRPLGRRDFFGGGGLDVAWHLLDDADGRLDLYGVGQVLDADRFGAHLGFAGTARPGPDWRLEGRLEGIALGEGYLWSPFDTGYLIDRYRRLLAAADELPAAYGGRAGLTVAFREALIVGAEYADADQAGRADLSVFVQVPAEPFSASLFWRQRAGPDRLSVFDPDEALAAAAARLALTEGWFADLAVARVWRVGAPEPPRYVPFTEVAATIEAAFDL